MGAAILCPNRFATAGAIPSIRIDQHPGDDAPSVEGFSIHQSALASLSHSASIEPPTMIDGKTVGRKNEEGRKKDEPISPIRPPHPRI